MNIVFWWAFTHQWGRCRACVCYQLADSATDLTPRRPHPLKITTWLSLVDAQAKVRQHWKEKNNHNKTRKFTNRSSITCNLVVKVARYSFSRSIPPKFERKLRRDKQRFGKIDTTVVLDKDKICYDQGCNDIGVVIATKWGHYLFYLQQYFLELGAVLPKSFTGVFSYNSGLGVREV